MPHAAPVTNSVADGGEAAAAPDEPPLGIDIDVVHDGGDWSTVADAENLVRRAVREAASALHLGRSEICVALSDNAQVAELNGSYRGKRVPTNVLSFPAGPSIPIDDNDPHFLGDVVLALETLQREAAELGLSIEHHMQHLVVHGLLHLLGYDHTTEEEAQVMESLEVGILGRLGIADPYAAAGEATDVHEQTGQR